MNKLDTFIGLFVTELGASVHAGMVVIDGKIVPPICLERSNSRLGRWLPFLASRNRSEPDAEWGGHEYDGGVFHGCERFF